LGTCGISHRWSSSRDDWSRSSSSNNSDIEDMLLDDWTSAAMVVSHLAPAHPPSISAGSKQSHQVANNLTG